MTSEAIESLCIKRLGCIAYAEAWRLQKAIHADVAEGRSPPTLLLLEHPRTITLGTSSNHAHLLRTTEFYQSHNIEIHQVERGGQTTYHGPGQLVGYPIVPVQRVGDFLRTLEDLLIRVLAGYGIASRGSPGYAGVWAGDAKVAAIGIAVKRRVSFHGFALNVSTDLEDFDLIVPCGMMDKNVTSLEQLLGAAPPMSEVADRVAAAFNDWMGAARC